MLFFTALICKNGDILTGRFEENPHYEQIKFCQKCGKDIIHECPNCKGKILGQEYRIEQIEYDDWYERNSYFYEETRYIGDYSLPAYCPSCAKPYPWTEARLNAARELIQEMTELDSTEQERFLNNLPDIIVDTPRTTVAATIIKKYLQKIEPIMKDGFKQLFFDISIEAAKRLIWP